MIYIRLDIVNKEEYEASDIYREIKILIPRDSLDLERDFEYLGLDYRNLSLQDTHIKECEIICEEDPDFSVNITGRLNRLIARAEKKGYTTSFNYIKEFYSLIQNLNCDDRNKFLSIFQAEDERIENIKDVIMYVKNLDKFYLDEDSYSYEEFAEKEIHLGEVFMEDVLPYIDLETLGKDLIEDRNAKLTDYGVLCRMDEDIEHENDEEFE